MAEVDGWLLLGFGGLGAVEVQGAVRCRRDLAEPVHVRGKIAAAKPVFASFHEEGIVAVLGPVIAIILVGPGAPAFGDKRLVAIPGNRVVPADRIGNDGAEYPAHIRIEAMAARKPEGLLAFQRIRRIVAFQRILRIVEQHADIGAARTVGERQKGAATRGKRPMFAAVDDGLVQGIGHGEPGL